MLSYTHSHLETAQFNHSLIHWPLYSSTRAVGGLRALLKSTSVVVMRKASAALSLYLQRFIEPVSFWSQIQKE